ncbi:hypothetical protein DNTS_015120 [Danionella cerebrum]|uniref:Uncharacterized protein n=1 Tax=Danionella cerebrum TaxID=2873325 RepID=A0A553P981_9TELE|nr:hypothetical protein DNTS_015120 [Danionella translucida]
MGLRCRMYVKASAILFPAAIEVTWIHFPYPPIAFSVYPYINSKKPRALCRGLRHQRHQEALLSFLPSMPPSFLPLPPFLSGNVAAEQQISSNLTYRTFPISHTDPACTLSFTQLCLQECLQAPSHTLEHAQEPLESRRKPCTDELKSAALPSAHTVTLPHTHIPPDQMANKQKEEEVQEECISCYLSYVDSGWPYLSHSHTHPGCIVNTLLRDCIIFMSCRHLE